MEMLYFRSKNMLQVTVKIACYVVFAKRGEDFQGDHLTVIK